MKLIAAYFHYLKGGLCTPLLLSIRQHSLMRMLLRRDLVNRTSGTVLGMLWPLLQPALQVAGFWFLFDIVYGMRVNRGPSFLAYLLTGMLPWLCLTEVLGRSAGMFREFSALFRRTPFPVEVLPVLITLIPAMVYTVVYAVTVLLVFDVFAALKAVLVISLMLLWLLPLILLCSVFGLFIRDFAQALPFILMLLMYSTPILYFPDMLPDQVEHFLWLNPFADLMAVIHGALQGPAVPLNAVGRLALLWLLMLAPAWLLFRRSEPHIREVL